jgi:hypothetical protein
MNIIAKTVVVASLLLAAPALASPRNPTPAQWRYIQTLEDAHEACVYSIKPEKIKAGCATADRLKKSLKARGFCFYGHGVVGRRGGSHCYTLPQRPR